MLWEHKFLALVKNKTIIGLKLTTSTWGHMINCVKNKTIIGLKYNTTKTTYKKIGLKIRL